MSDKRAVPAMDKFLCNILGFGGALADYSLHQAIGGQLSMKLTLFATIGKRHTGNLPIAPPTRYSADEFFIRPGAMEWMSGYLISILSAMLNPLRDDGANIFQSFPGSSLASHCMV